MKRKKDDDPPPPKAKRNKGKANDDGFQETPLLRKGKNVHTALKAAKEDTSSPGPLNAVINENASMPVVNKDTSAQAVLPAPITSTSCTSTPIKAS
ncbi:uncharacterized protein RHIMIDRAFT_237295 [Rhizopus microsporus ATCC 52813]|uniref:Uncharacterized protein n=1 Tax=Rhizopus microsporus ATCC 52813 TaxID=1340429 RepID=A0A2G4SWX2_RHIZD|nr:uncharacterized protein RHIMIDRAFT_237295 [Rhizopus microsporus ATCC 52813]PHZ13283.1 hypothetical protein RHIMIDRAFT_237295 [Rhizopus microsporus ATCC 52813]